MVRGRSQSLLRQRTLSDADAPRGKREFFSSQSLLRQRTLSDSMSINSTANPTLVSIASSPANPFRQSKPSRDHCQGGVSIASSPAKPFQPCRVPSTRSIVPCLNRFFASEPFPTFSGKSVRNRDGSLNRFFASEPFPTNKVWDNFAYAQLSQSLLRQRTLSNPFTVNLLLPATLLSQSLLRQRTLSNGTHRPLPVGARECLNRFFASELFPTSFFG